MIIPKDYNFFMNSWKVYIVECKDGSLYTGVSNNVEKRIEVHNQGKGAAYTNSRRPVKLLYSEDTASQSEALKREAQIKNLSRNKKLDLVNKSMTQ